MEETTQLINSLRQFSHIRAQETRCAEFVCSAVWPEDDTLLLSLAHPSPDGRALLGYFFGYACASCRVLTKDYLALGTAADPICEQCRHDFQRWARRMELSAEDDRSLVAWLAMRLRTAAERPAVADAAVPAEDHARMVKLVLAALPGLIEDHPFGIKSAALARALGEKRTAVNGAIKALEKVGAARVFQRKDASGVHVAPLGYDVPPVRLTYRQAKVLDGLKVLTGAKQNVELTYGEIRAASGLDCEIHDSFVSLEHKGMVRLIRWESNVSYCFEIADQPFARWRDEPAGEDSYREFRRLRWPETNGEPVCPSCGSTHAYKLKRDGRFTCGACHRQYSATSGTIFARHKLPFRRLLILARALKGGNILRASKIAGVQYKSAYAAAKKQGAA